MREYKTTASRKWGSVCLALAILALSLAIVPADAAQHNEAGEIAYQLMRVVGVLDENAAPDAWQQVTRADLIRAVTALGRLSPEGFQDSAVPYTDITREDEIYGMVSAAYHTGLLPFAVEETLQPDAAVTRQELGAGLVAVLGYGALSAAQGGYPLGYAANAARLHLLPGGEEQTVTWGLLAGAIENTLRTKPLLLYQVGDGIGYREASAPLMTETFQLRSVEGVLRADAFTDLYFPDSGLQEGFVHIGDMTLDARGLDTESLLGCRVEAYYRDTQSHAANELVCAAPHRLNVRVAIGHGELVSADKSGIKYAPKNERTKSLLLSDSVVLLYNGKHVPLDMNLLWPKHGEIAVIDNDGDGRYDVILVLDYRIVVADRISQDGGTISDKIGGAPIVLDPTDQSYGFRIWKNGAAAAFSDLAPGDVLLVAKSQGGGRGKWTVRARNTQISGTVTAVSGEELEINAEEVFRMAERVQETVRLGSDATFYLDDYGAIVYLQAGQSRVYGYLNGLRSGTFGSIEARIFTQNGHWVTLPFQEKVAFNGTKTDADDVYEMLGGSDATAYRQLVTYCVSTDRKIRELNTAVSVRRWSEEEETCIDNDVFRLNYSGALNFRENGKTFDGLIAPHAGTVLIVVPNQKANQSKEEDFSIASVGNLKEVSYSIQAFDCDRLYQPAVCIVNGILTEPNNIAGPSNVMIVERVGVGLNPADEEAYAIRGLYKGMTVHIYTQNKQMIDAMEGGLQKGDVIQFVLDSKGCAASVERMFCSKGEIGYAASNGMYNKNSMFLSGKMIAEDRERSRISVRYSEQSAYVLDTAARLQNVYVYEQPYDRLRSGSLDDLAVGDFVFVSARYSQVVEVVVVKTY